MREWENEAVFILGGGPSLAAVDVDRLRGHGRVIALNNAGTVLMPDADVLFFADSRWYDWNRDDLNKHTGKYKITRQQVCDPDVIEMEWIRRGWSTEPGVIGGYCGGSSAVNLAELFGARVAFLLGFDMRGANWHELHKEPQAPDCYERFIAAFEALKPMMKITVINCTPGSALQCFPFADLDRVLTTGLASPG